MRSHEYQFQGRDIARLLGAPLCVALGFSALMHGGARLRWLPEPRPRLDVDRTVLVHQVEASRQRQDAEILLVGDSSCLMDVSASQLSARLGRPVLNLGTLSYLDLNAYALLLKEYLRANSHPSPLRAVVLLMHPEALRRLEPERYHMRLLQQLLAGADAAPEDGIHGKLSLALGLEIWRGRVLSRWVPAPLPGAFGRFYGFSRQLDDFMRRHRGSLVDPSTTARQGNAEYRLAVSLEASSRAFRSAVPEGVRLYVGITPVPARFAGQAYPKRHPAMLAQWSGWLGAEALDLPPTLPDEGFSGVTHLNAAGCREYTETLARALMPLASVPAPAKAAEATTIGGGSDSPHADQPD
jgi:hypothetical protein